jgi:hypothetical protein
MDHVEKISEQLQALSAGSRQKFKLIDFLRKYGETTFADLELGMLPLRKSTLYNYLNDLVKVEIVEKRVVRDPGKRPSSFYSLGKGINIHLTPQTISDMLGGKGEVQPEPGELDRLAKPPEIKVIDKGERETIFHPSVLMTDLLNAGIKLEDGIEATMYVMENIYDGIHVDKIKKLAAGALGEKDERLTAMYEWYIDAPLTVELPGGKIAKWDRAHLVKELEKRWVGVEKSKIDLELMAVKVERDIKKIQRGTVKSEFVLGCMDAILGS